MMAPTLALSALLAALLLPAQRISDYRDPQKNYAEGWTTLFNGKDLKGWAVVLRNPDSTAKKYREEDTGQQTVFTVENGLLKTTGTPSGFIRTLDVYGDYVFHVEVRFPERGNSGVLIHAQNDAVWPKAIECQLYESHMGRIFPIVGATLDGGEMIHANSKPSGEWNVYEVYSEEGRIATVVNGAVVALASNANPRNGYICLQSEGVPAEFRNIRIRTYTPRHGLRTK
ncbi:MAG: 3-keto-disaccharide hydrolase [Bryobacteraceae bacterium]